jgi:hypothetical protein
MRTAMSLPDPLDHILSDETYVLLLEWAQGIGLSLGTVNSMSAVELANVYAASHSGKRMAQAVIDVTMALCASPAPVAAPQPIIPALPETPHHMAATVATIASLGHPVMLVGPAGCGKTTIAEHTAATLNLPFHITNAINDTHELMGFIDGYGKYHDTPFRRAFEHGGVWIADEIDAWDASALLSANSALANGFASFPDVVGVIRRHTDFRMVGTANTFGTGSDRIYVGRNELDGASLDRFAMIEVDYDKDLERKLSNGNERWLKRVWKAREKVMQNKIRHVVSTRAITMGSAALQAGLTLEQVDEYYLFKGMSERDRGRITL